MSRPAFSQQPGAHERQLMRRHDSPLFPATLRQITEREVEAARERDQAELEAFMERFRQVVQRAADLEASAQSDEILELKEELDKCYEQCAGLRGDQTRIKEAIAKLVATMMRAVRKGAENDAMALKKLEEEDTARAMHYELLEEPLVADLLRPEPVIEAGELVPTLLSAPPDAMASAARIFTPEQIALLLADARDLLAASDLPADSDTRARRNIALLEAELTAGEPATPTLN